MAGISATGKVIDVGDQVTIVGEAIAITGSGQTALVTVRMLDSLTTFVAMGGDMYAQSNVPSAINLNSTFVAGVALSKDGQPFGVGAQVSVEAFIQSVSGSGQSATVSSALSSSVAKLATASAVVSPTAVIKHPASKAHSSHNHK